METLLIGNIKKIDAFYKWLNVANEIFDVKLIIAEDNLKSEKFDCRIEPLAYVESITNEYDIIFVCSDFADKIAYVLVQMGIEKEKIHDENTICKYLSKSDRMSYYAQKTYEEHNYKRYEDVCQIGQFTYGKFNIMDYKEGIHLQIGKFCSIGSGVIFMLGGEHRGDWCTTYPFNGRIQEFSYITGHPRLKGDIVVGNDVWIGSDVKIMSGVHIGDGCIIGANAVVTKDIEPYTVAVGVPAKVVKKRFDDKTIKLFTEMQWWNWGNEDIYNAVPLLQSEKFDQLFQYYKRQVKGN